MSCRCVVRGQGLAFTKSKRIDQWTASHILLLCIVSYIVGCIMSFWSQRDPSLVLTGKELTIIGYWVIVIFAFCVYFEFFLCKKWFSKSWLQKKMNWKKQIGKMFLGLWFIFICKRKIVLFILSKVNLSSSKAEFIRFWPLGGSCSCWLILPEVLFDYMELTYCSSNKKHTWNLNWLNTKVASSIQWPQTNRCDGLYPNIDPYLLQPIPNITQKITSSFMSTF